MTEKLENENQELKRGLDKITKQKSQLENDKDQSKVTRFLSNVNSLGTIQVLRQQRGGWGQKMAIFADLQYYLC